MNRAAEHDNSIVRDREGSLFVAIQETRKNLLDTLQFSEEQMAKLDETIRSGDEMLRSPEGRAFLRNAATFWETVDPRGKGWRAYVEIFALVWRRLNAKYKFLASAGLVLAFACVGILICVSLGPVQAIIGATGALFAQFFAGLGIGAGSGAAAIGIVCGIESDGAGGMHHLHSP